MIIRQFRTGDTQDVISLWERCGLTRAWNDPARDISRKTTDSPWGMLVGEIDSVVVAAMMVGYDGHRGSVNYLAVTPELQGRGLGAQLMAHAEALLRDRGCPKINLQVRGENRKVIEFYTARGYEASTSTQLVNLGLRLIADV